MKNNKAPVAPHRGWRYVLVFFVGLLFGCGLIWILNSVYKASNIYYQSEPTEYYAYYGLEIGDVINPHFAFAKQMNGADEQRVLYKTQSGPNLYTGMQIFVRDCSEYTQFRDKLMIIGTMQIGKQAFPVVKLVKDTEECRQYKEAQEYRQEALDNLLESAETIYDDN